ncbi:hypothetical protein [Pseudomonas sp. M2]|uniref:hypothetical protein n=1 Tax=Pseudomonas sp. M2 TaxID=228756 RepID=UPI0018CA1791|nr:hypothetical protein [Pseudomonas sp. M2]MBG6128034.1 hypothetical protein [Pseudomonas sp. M2]HDS1743911.1 hypothetical protein [Pseudomonas putida]
MDFMFRIWDFLFPDHRPEGEIRREREFIDALNQLKTLRATYRGGMSIDPEEIREQVLRSREAVKDLVDPAHRKRSNTGAEG